MRKSDTKIKEVRLQPMNKNYKYLLLVAGLIFASLACNFGTRSSQLSQTPIPEPTQVIDSLEENPDQVLRDSENPEEVTLSITEGQLTSLVANEIQGQDDYPIKDPQVHLQDGQIRFTATVVQQNLSLPAEVVMTIQPDSSGHPQVDVVSAKIGPLPLPGKTVDDLESGLNSAFANEIESEVPNIRIENIIIANGVMTITGKAR
jgi:hypothetical protein